ncbi:MAG TPA: cation:proton antiporter [Pseudonocardiaceae bacterium]|nr:cation:proton antiporter [Pseudonocardiaceae bacterium]
MIYTYRRSTAGCSTPWRTCPAEARWLGVHFTNLLIIVVVAFVAPLGVNALPGVRVPSPVLEIMAGILLGPSVLGWVHVDAPVQILALIGLASCCSWPAWRSTYRSYAGDH